MTTTHVGANPFVHEALFYRGADEYLDGTLSFIHGGLVSGEPVLVAVPGQKVDLIWSSLGEDAPRVRFLDMATAGRNPGRIIPTVLLAFVKEHAGRRVRIIGEPIWSGRSPVEYPPCVQHEALINVAVAGRPATILCPYDAVRLPAHVLADAEVTHPILALGGLRSTSDRYTEPAAVVESFNRPLSDPVGDVVSLEFDGASLGTVRRAAAQEAVIAGLRAERALALQIAVHEMAVNTVEHTPSGGTLRIWREGDQVVCDITDGGRFEDPLAGRREAPTSLDGVRGLLLIHVLCDLVEVYSRPDSTTLRVRMAMA